MKSYKVGDEVILVDLATLGPKLQAEDWSTGIIRPDYKLHFKEWGFVGATVQQYEEAGTYFVCFLKNISHLILLKLKYGLEVDPECYQAALDRAIKKDF